MKKYVILCLITTMLSGCSIAESKDDSVTLTEQNVLILDSQVDDRSVSKVMQRALELNAKLPKNKPLYLVLDTPGGSVDSGLALITMLKGLDRPVHTITMFAASMGFQIAQGLDDRLILPNGVLMSHHARGGVNGEFGGSKGSQLDKRVGWMVGIIDRLDRQTVLRTKGKKTLEQYQSEYENELWALSEDAIKNGYADKIVIPRCDKSLSGTTTEEKTFLGMKIELKASKCPLVKGLIEMKVSVRTNDNKWLSLEEFQAKNGVFGQCPLSPVRSVCAFDTSLTLSVIETIKNHIAEKRTLDWKKRNITFEM